MVLSSCSLFLNLGRQEGRQEGILDTARNFKKLGASLQDIAAATGLSIEEIQNI